MVVCSSLRLFDRIRQATSDCSGAYGTHPGKRARARRQHADVSDTLPYLQKDERMIRPRVSTHYVSVIAPKAVSNVAQNSPIPNRRETRLCYFRRNTYDNIQPQYSLHRLRATG